MIMTMTNYACLVVEDSPMMRQLIVFALSRIKNMTVTEADDGIVGLKKLAQARFDLIISDINMPVLNGFQLRDTFNLDPLVNFKRIPYLFFSTAPSHPDVISDPITSNIQGIFKKPVKHSEWKETLSTIVRYWTLSMPEDA